MRSMTVSVRAALTAAGSYLCCCVQQDARGLFTCSATDSPAPYSLPQDHPEPLRDRHRQRERRFHKNIYRQNFQHHYFSLDPSEIILICWFTAQETFLLLSMLKTVVLLHIFMETVILVFKDSFINRMLKSTAFICFCNIINVCTDTFDQFNASLQNKSIICFQKYFLCVLH